MGKNNINEMSSWDVRFCSSDFYFDVQWMVVVEVIELFNENKLKIYRIFFRRLEYDAIKLQNSIGEIYSSSRDDTSKWSFLKMIY